MSVRLADRFNNLAALYRSCLKVFGLLEARVLQKTQHYDVEQRLHALGTWPIVAMG